ncbi:MAG: Flp pilus assembly complex ATPase component TadA [Thermoguttaceae bacterium]|nr:Flp pilus assembly complex ATPase component TadA [Thermoguttaceae bacterium]
MRQMFMMRLFIVYLAASLLAWGGSVLPQADFDLSVTSSVMAQDAEEDAAEEDSEEYVEEDGETEDAEDAEDVEDVEDAENAEEEADGDEDAAAEDEEADGEEDADNAEEEGVSDGSSEDADVPSAGVPSVPTAPTAPPTDLKSVFRTMDSFGGYAALWKILAAVIIYLAWVFSTDWMSTDCIRYGFNGKKWIPTAYGAFWGGMILFWVIPFFWVSYLFLIAGWAVPLTMFVRMHNQDLSSGEQVLTPEHLRFVFARMMSYVGVKVDTKVRDRHEVGFPVVLNPHGKNKVDTEQWRIQARAHAGFPNAREILSKLMVVHPEGFMLDYTANGVSSRYLLDGVWNSSEGFTRELADPALQALKILAGMKPEDRKNKQEGAFRIDFEYEYTFPEDRLKVKQAEDALKEVMAEENKAKIREMERHVEKAKESVRAPEKRKRSVLVHFTTQGVQGGERAVFLFEQEKIPFKALADLGMSDEMEQKIRTQMKAEKGFMVFSAPNTSGLRTTMKLTLLKTDRYTREFYEIEDGIHEYDEVENVTKVPIHSKDIDFWRSEMRSLFLKDPNVVIVRDIPSPEITNDMLDEIENEERFMITTVRAKDAAEAILRIMATKCDAEKWVRNLNAVVCQRLVRKLCEHCKESYLPPVETLRQIGATEKIHIFRTPTPVQPKPGEKPQEPCPECRGLGYAGRTAMFELVIIGDETRKVLLHSPKLELVRAALKKDGNRFMAAEGMRLVREGITSLQELKRALS